MSRESYLLKGLKSLSSIGGSLFIHGHSLSSNDQHIFDCLLKNNKLEEIYISYFGTPDDIIKNANNIFSNSRFEEGENLFF